MKWLWHVDLNLAKRVDRNDLMRTAGMGFDILKSRRNLQDGDTMIIVVVRPPKTESNRSEASNG